MGYQNTFLILSIYLCSTTQNQLLINSIVLEMLISPWGQRLSFQETEYGMVG